MEQRRQRMTVFVEGLELMAQIGIYDHEYDRRQPLILDVEMGVAAPDADSISAAVDYQAVIDAANRVIERGHIQLVEHVAQEVAVDLLRNKRVLDVRVRVAKPEAFTTAHAAGATWSVSRLPDLAVSPGVAGANGLARTARARSSGKRAPMVTWLDRLPITQAILRLRSALRRATVA